MEITAILSKLIDRISNYHFLNNIIPGALFCVALPYVTEYNLLRADDIWCNLLIIYIAGIILSRFGSVFVEWLYKKWMIITFVDHNKYAKAAEKAPFIKTLSMENNMYRTFIALFVLLLLAKLSDWIGSVWAFGNDNILWILCLLLLLLFSFAYSKQTKYVVKHIQEQLKKEEKKED